MLIFLPEGPIVYLSNFSVRPSSVCLSVVLSVTLSSGRPLCETCLSGTQSEVKTGSDWDILQNHTLWKTIRMSHLTIPWPFLSLSGRNCHDLARNVISRTQSMWHRLGKLERFLHNMPFGPPLPCGCNLENYWIWSIFTVRSSLSDA